MTTPIGNRDGRGAASGPYSKTIGGRGVARFGLYAHAPDGRHGWITPSGRLSPWSGEAEQFDTRAAADKARADRGLVDSTSAVPGCCTAYVGWILK